MNVKTTRNCMLLSIINLFDPRFFVVEHEHEQSSKGPTQLHET
jgi:hypothetical protein